MTGEPIRGNEFENFGTFEVQFLQDQARKTLTWDLKYRPRLDALKHTTLKIYSTRF